VVRETQRSVAAARRQLRRLPPAAQGQARRALTRLATMLPRVQQVVRQTRGRIVHGVTTGADKLVSLFEPSAQILRRGKLHRPTEFGALVKVQETEGGIVTEIAVVDGRTTHRCSCRRSRGTVVSLGGRPDSWRLIAASIPRTASGGCGRSASITR